MSLSPAQHEPHSANTPVDSETASDPFDTPLFRQLLNLMVEQNATLKEQKETLLNHDKKLDTLVKDALKGMFIS